MKFSRQEYWTGLPFSSPGLRPYVRPCPKNPYCCAQQVSGKSSKSSWHPANTITWPQGSPAQPRCAQYPQSSTQVGIISQSPFCLTAQSEAPEPSFHGLTSPSSGGRWEGVNSVKLAFANPSWSWGPALGDSPGPLSCPSDGHIRELQAPPGRSVEGRDQVLKKK